jgi:hypothetical protein
VKIVWHANSPWTTTGYGQQTALFAPRIAALGHDVVISAFIGLQGKPVEWNGLTVLPGGQDTYNNDVYAERAALHFDSEPGVVITLTDVWVLSPEIVAQVPTASWMPVDTKPLSAMDHGWLKRSHALPIAMSRFGHQQLIDAGHNALYVPHAVDVDTFRPHEDRASLRDEMAIPRDAFVVGINAANRGKDPSRKAFPQQFEAFARLHRRHRDAVLLVHSQVKSPFGMDLTPLIADLGIADAVRFSDQYAYTSGMLTPAYLAGLYNCCDVVSNASYGEGFGLPILEAQACGVPVITTDCSAMSELTGAGWRVRGHRYWVPMHQAWWMAPDVDHLTRTLVKAYDGEAAKRSARARDFALGYDADKVLVENWKPALESLEQWVADWSAPR